MTSNTPSSGNLYPGPGFRIRSEFPRLSSALMDRFEEFEVPDISDVLNRLHAVDSAITCQTKIPLRICRPACTVRVYPGDNLMVHKALDVARPGDVVVVDAGGDRSSNAVLGDRICAKARHRGIAGFVVDGLVRDLEGIDQLEIPVFARGTTAVGPLHRGPGEINYPICCGGTVVNPGDVIIADISGIIAIPRESAADVLQRVAAQQEHQREYLAALERGEFSNDWVDQVLEMHDCPVEDCRSEANRDLNRI